MIIALVDVSEAGIKLKTIDGYRLEKWSMLFNTIIPVEPYHTLNISL